MFANVFRGGFVLDDHFLVERNPRAHSLDGIRLAFSTDVQRFQSGGAAPPAYYRPLTLASYVVDYALWGARPGPHHLADVIAHALAALLAFLLFRRLFSTVWSAAAAAALWAVHPVMSESVAWISGRTDPFALCGVLAALLAWLCWRDGGGRRWLALAAIATYVACLAKESALLTPLMALAVGPLAKDSRRPPGEIRRGLAVLAVPVVVIIVQRWAVMGAFSTAGFAGDSWAGATRIALRAWVYYARSLVWPRALVGDIHAQPPPWSDPAVIAGALLAVAVLAALVLAWRRRARIAAPLALFVLSMLPVSGVLVALPTPVALRYLYMPALWLAAALILAIERPLARARTWAPAAAALLVAGALAPLTIARNAEYRDDATLYRAILRHAEGAGLGIEPGYSTLLNYGAMIAGEKRLVEAEALTRRAAAQQPRALNVWLNLGFILAWQEKGEEALAAWGHAAELFPDSPEPPYDMALQLDKFGRRDEALRQYRAALAKGLPPPRSVAAGQRIRELEGVAGSGQGGSPSPRQSGSPNTR